MWIKLKNLKFQLKMKIKIRKIILYKLKNITHTVNNKIIILLIIR